MKPIDRFMQREFGENSRRTGIPIKHYALTPEMLAQFNQEQEEYRAQKNARYVARRRARQSQAALPSHTPHRLARRSVGDFSLLEDER
jgi:hypothetical protein